MFTAHELPRNHVYMIKSTIQLVKYTSWIISYSKKHFFHALAAIFQNLTTISEQNMVICLSPGGRLNKKDGLTSYGDSHVKDKTSWRPSYL